MATCEDADRGETDVVATCEDADPAATEITLVDTADPAATGEALVDTATTGPLKSVWQPIDTQRLCFFQALSAVRFWFAVCQFVLPEFAFSACGVGRLALVAGFLSTGMFEPAPADSG